VLHFDITLRATLPRRSGKLVRFDAYRCTISDVQDFYQKIF
jgi:hypothetical protein